MDDNREAAPEDTQGSESMSENNQAPSEQEFCENGEAKPTEPLNSDEVEVDALISTTQTTESNPSVGIAAEQLPEAQEIRSAGFCPKCGTPLKYGMPFCGSCGAKVGTAPQVEQAPKAKKRINFVAIIGATAALIAVILVVTIVVPAVTATPDDLLAQGKYEAAYSKASDDEKMAVLGKLIGAGQFQIAYDVAPDDQKDNVLVANVVSVVSNDIVDGFKDSSSFVLKAIYFSKDSNEIVLEVSGNNSYGARVSNYYDYRYESGDNEYQLYTSVSDLEDEKIYTYADSSSEKFEKRLKNLARESMRTIIADKDNKLDDVYVDAVNELFTADQLSNVTLISAASNIYPNGASA